MGKADTTASGTFQEQKGNESGSPINPKAALRTPTGISVAAKTLPNHDQCDQGRAILQAGL
jgi:hypothetical protein